MILPIPYLDRAIDLLKPSNALFDDAVDRLNYHITGLILIFSAMMVGAKQFLGKPIQCYFQESYTGAMEEYVEDYCFIEGTYFLHDSSDITSETKANAHVVNYYQWVPLFFAAQAMCFFLPRLFWKVMCRQTGVEVESILQQAREASSQSDEKSRLKQIQLLAHCMEDSLSIKSEPIGHCWTLPCFRNYYFGAFISLLYIFVKVLYLLNLAAQFLIMNQFLGENYGHFWGFDIAAKLYYGLNWKETGYFPRVTFCDFQIRRLGNNMANHSVQCVLMINLFNEKIYICLYFWMFLVSIATTWSLFSWIIQLASNCFNEKMIYRYVRLATNIRHRHEYDEHMTSLIKRFCRNVLRADGILLIRFIGKMSGERVAIELTGAIWDEFRRSLMPEVTGAFTNVLNKPDNGFRENVGGSNGELLPRRYHPTTPTDSVAPARLNPMLLNALLPSAPPSDNNADTVLLMEPPRSSGRRFADSEQKPPLPPKPSTFDFEHLG